LHAGFVCLLRTEAELERNVAGVSFRSAQWKSHGRPSGSADPIAS
jgi:hypothetical protein